MQEFKEALSSEEAMLADIKKYLASAECSNNRVNKKPLKKEAQQLINAYTDTKKAKKRAAATGSATSSSNLGTKLSRSVNNSSSGTPKKMPPVKVKLSRSVSSSSMNSIDSLLDKMAAEPRKSHTLSGDQMKVKLKNFAYTEKMVKSETIYELDIKNQQHVVDSANRLNDKLFHASATNKKEPKTFSAFTYEHMNKRYARFCKGFSFTDEELNACTNRNDLWTARFMEECYDEAFSSCHAAISVDRWRVRNGFDLGSLDSFPQVVKRLFAIRYSVMEVRKKIILQFLNSLETMLDLEDRAVLGTIKPHEYESHAFVGGGAGTGTGGNNMQNVDTTIFNGKRASLFAKFFSEEYDADFLALYLQKRDTMQAVLQHKLKDVNQTRVWIEVEAEKHSKMTVKTAHASSLLDIGLDGDFSVVLPPAPPPQSMPAKGKAKKKGTGTTDVFKGTAVTTKVVAPSKGKSVPSFVSLPRHWLFCGDCALTEAPLVSFHVSQLPLFCMYLLPDTPVPLQRYLAERVLAFAKNCIVLDMDDNAAAGNMSHADTLSAAASIISTSMDGGGDDDDDDDDRAGGGGGRRGGASVADTLSARSLTKSRAAARRKEVLARVDIQHIPLSCMMTCLCEEWGKITFEVKMGMMEAGNPIESLRSLNDIYDDNCKMMKDLIASIKATEMELSNAHSVVLNLERNLRKLDRRWKQGTATEVELNEIEDVKRVIEAARMTKLETDSRLKGLLKKQYALRKTIEDLWATATLEKNPEPGSKGEEEAKEKAAGTVAGMAGMAAAAAGDVGKKGEIAAAPTIARKRKKKQLDRLRKHVAQTDWKHDVAALFARVLERNKTSHSAAELNAIEATLHAQNESDDDDDDDSLLQAAESKEYNKTLTTSIPYVDERLTNNYELVEIMAKITVRNVMKEGMRKVALTAFLSAQEHKLLLQYGGSEYLEKERQRLQAEKDARIAEMRYKLMCKLVKAFAPVIVDEVIEEAIPRAVDKLYDVWHILDLDPSTFVVPHVLRKVEQMCSLYSLRDRKQKLSLLFHYLARPFRMARFTRKRHKKICSMYFGEFVKYAHRGMHMHKMASRIQKMSVRALWRGRCSTHLESVRSSEEKADSHRKTVLWGEMRPSLRFWKKWSRLQQLEAQCVFNRKDRKFIQSFYIWRDQFKKHKFSRIQLSSVKLRKLLIIQLYVRAFIARRRVRLKRAVRRIVCAGRGYLARKALTVQRRKVGRLYDFEQSTAFRCGYYLLRTGMKVWRSNYRFIRGFERVEKAVNNDMLRRRVKKWVTVVAFLNRSRIRKRIIIQSTIRMWLSKVTILNYYKWRRGLVAIQGLVRQRPCIRAYVVDIYYYRKAKKIQTAARGYIIRRNLTKARIEDVHFSAGANNYDRLQFYIHKYPELVSELDNEGNTALHSAAKTASKRTLKQLVKFGLDVNALNLNGYSALHLLIMSSHPDRDEVCVYMLERGFDEEQLAPEGKTCMLLAAEYERNVILTKLLEWLEPTEPDHNGLTCLQAACQRGNLPMVAKLIEHGSDVCAPGQGGTYPLHDCVSGGNVEVANLLFHHGAYVNVVDTYNQQTPLIWAAYYGHGAFARLYILQGADVEARDVNGQTAAHHAASSNSHDMYNALREADADFDVVDLAGDTPLHLACQAGADVYAQQLLYGGAFPSTQNNLGNQPCHIAARYDYIDILKDIALYDRNIGRINYGHMTCLGVAKFYNSGQCREFLEKHFRLTAITNGRNEIGDIWWDKEIDAKAALWEVIVDPKGGDRAYRHKLTGEVSALPPSVSLDAVQQAAKGVEVPRVAAVVMVKESDPVNKHSYLAEKKILDGEVTDMTRDYRNATIIIKFARRKLAYMALRRERIEKHRDTVIKRFLKRYMPNVMRWKKYIRDKATTRIQCSWRGYWLRKTYFAKPNGRYYVLRVEWAERTLRYKLWGMWKSYIGYLQFSQLISAAGNKLVTLADWQVVLDLAIKPLRRVGMYEEWLYPKTRDIKFYRHATTGNCSFEKPKKMEYLDELAANERKQIAQFGCTNAQLQLVIKIQAIYRGYMIRSYSRYVEQAMAISMTIQDDYLRKPDDNKNLFNYCLHTFVILQDIPRSRLLFVEALRRMEARGPDVSFVLYSYAIYALATHDLDYMDVIILVDRARKAEVARDAFNRKKKGIPANKSIEDGTFAYGTVYALANAGFYRYAANTINNATAWENYALCRFLVFREFNSSFDAFMEAFKTDPKNKKLRTNFDHMMEFFHGTKKTELNRVVRERMQYHAQRDADFEEMRRITRDKRRAEEAASTRIKDWYKERKRLKKFNKFMASVRKQMANSKQQAQQKQAQLTY